MESSYRNLTYANCPFNNFASCKRTECKFFLDDEQLDEYSESLDLTSVKKEKFKSYYCKFDLLFDLAVLNNIALKSLAVKRKNP